MKTEVNVTQDNINNGGSSPLNNPLALALRRIGCKQPYVNSDQIITGSGEIGKAFSNTKELNEWMKRAYNRDVKPTTIILDTNNGQASIKKVL